MPDERNDYTARVLGTWSALYPLCLVMLTVALIVVIVFTAADPLTAVLVTVPAGFGLARVLH